MKTIVYLQDGSIEATIHADAHVAAGIARYATSREVASYGRGFQRDDAKRHDPDFYRELAWEEHMLHGESQPS